MGSPATIQHIAGQSGNDIVHIREMLLSVFRSFNIYVKCQSALTILIYTTLVKSSNTLLSFSLNRISPSKLSLCATKEPNGPVSLEQNPVGSDSGSHKDEIRSISSEEFLAMERSAELDEPLPPPPAPNPSLKEIENLSINGKLNIASPLNIISSVGLQSEVKTNNIDGALALLR